MRIKGTTRIFRGPHARNRPYQVTLCPKHRPPRPQHPVFSVFTQWVCTLASNRDLTAATWGNDVIRTPTRRRHAGSQLLMLQNPHRRRCGGCRGTAKYGGGAGDGGRARAAGSSGPAGATKFAQHGPSPTQPATKFAQHATNSQFWAIFRALGELFRARAHHQTEQGEKCRTLGTETRAS